MVKAQTILRGICVELLDKQRQDATSQVASQIDGWEGFQFVKSKVENKEARFRMKFVGRQSKLHKLELFVSQAVSGKGGIVFVSGEGGIGKSRLAEELRERCTHSGVKSLNTVCYEDSRLVPYSPWIDLIEQVSHKVSATQFLRLTGNYANQIIRILPKLDIDQNSTTKRRPKVDSLSTTTMTERGRIIFYSAIAHFFLRLSETPTILFFDDFHLADSASLDLLQFVQRRARDNPLMIVCLYQESERLGSLADLLQKQSSDSCEMIHLDKLTEPDVDELIDAKFGNASRRVKKLIFTKTGGNPLFIQELVNSLIEDNALTTNQSGLADLRYGSEIKVPRTVRETISVRLDRLDPETRNVLCIASVLGREFSFESLCEVADVSQEKLNEALKLASAANLASTESKDGNLIVRFSEEWVRDELYTRLDAAKRLEYHERAAVLLERKSDSKLPPVANQLALHFIESGNSKKAVEYCLISGERASLLYAHEEARAYYSLALEQVSKTDTKDEAGDLQKGKLLARIGDQTELLGLLDESLEHREKAVDLLKNVHSGRQVAAETYRKIGLVYHMLKLDKTRAMEYYANAVKILEGESSLLYLGYTHGDIGLAHLWSGEADLAKKEFDKALSIAKSVDAVSLEALTLSEYSAALPPSEWSKARGYLDRSLELVRKGIDFEESAYCYYYSAILHAIMDGASKESLQFFLDGLAYCEKVDVPWPTFIHKVELALEVYLPTGELKKARKIAEELYAISGMFGGRYLILDLAGKMTLGRILLALGEIEKSEALLTEVASKARDFGSLQLIVPTRTDLASIYVEKGERGKASVYLNEAYNALKKRGLMVESAKYFVDLLSKMIEIELESTKNGERLNELVDELHKAVKSIDTEWARAYEFRADGMVLASSPQSLESAVQSFSKSIAIWRKIAWPLELGKTLFQLARARKLSKDFESSEDALSQALEIFEQHGALLDLRKTQLELANIRELSRLSRVLNNAFPRESTRDVFELMVRQFFEDNSIAKLSIDNSGWRTLNELSRLCKLPRSSFYTSASRGGEVFKELVKSGLVETRVYPGERGRGGNVLKMRVAFDKNKEIRDYVGLISDGSKR
jgi:tetratricopeptide (TPR) repeat protein